jgi:peptidoglycan-associated lipoprotein
METVSFVLRENARRVLRLCLVAGLALALAACAGNKKGDAVNGSTGVSGADSDYVNGTPLPERREGISFLDPSVSKSQFAPVHFGFDSFAVSAEEAGKVRAVAEYLRGVPNGLIVAGFTDERGTAEYNRALGEKRAGAVREALIRQGVSAERIQTVSFGVEMPVDPASNESAWAKNRRAEFGVTRQ